MKPNGMASEKVVKEMIKCRTCLGPLNPSSCTDITKEHVLGKTVKEILLVFTHRMTTSPTVGDLICSDCTIQVRNFAKYMENFINVEKAIIEDTIKKQRESTKDQVNSKNAPVNIIYVIPTIDQNGIQNLVKPLQPVHLQTVPINCLLASTDNSNMDMSKKVVPLGEIATQRTSNNQRFLLPKIEKPNKTYTKGVLSLKKSVESVDDSKEKQRDTSLGNRICKTCGDVFTSSNLTIKKCSKCFPKQDNIEVISSDSSCNNYYNNNDSNDDDDVIIENDPIILIKEDEDIKEEPIKKHEPIKKGVPIKDEPEVQVLLKNIRKEFRDTIISVTQNSDQIYTVANDILTRVRVIDYGPSFSTKKKRILFLGSTMVQCMQCQVLLDQPRNLKAHFLEAHSNISISESDSDLDGDGTENAMKKKAFDCPFCDEKLTTAMLLVEHLHELHTLNNPFKCKKCEKEFKKREAYLDHMKKFQDSPNCSFKKCRFCPKLVDQSEYHTHLVAHRDIVCDKCGRNFLSISNFNAHYATHLGEPPAPVEPKERPEEAHLCPICGKLLNNSRNMNLHLTIHEERTRDYICDKCPKRFLTKNVLRHHLKTAHEEGKYECSICHIKVKTISALNSHHNLKHVRIYSHICKICGDGFTRGDYYRRHLIKHTRQGPHITARSAKKKYNYTGKIESKPGKCKYCLKIFKNVYVLRTHVLTHVKSMRYKCKFCDMTFANMGTRFRHQKRHADPNFDLSCTVCWRRMESKEELAVHLARHAEMKKYKCTECGEYLASKYLLRHHMSERHIPQEQVEKEKQIVLSTALEEFLIKE